jgi:hypothetical protein
MMNDKLKAMYAGGGLLKALLKDPKQREMAKGMLNKMEMGGKMDYGMGGAMKYRMGGNMPGEDEVVTEMMLDKIQDSTRGNFEMVGEDFLQQREEDISDSGKLLKFFAVKEAARMLDEEGISPRGMKPQELLNAARKKGLNPMRGAKDLFDREIDRRRGMSEFETDSEFRA